MMNAHRPIRGHERFRRALLALLLAAVNLPASAQAPAAAKAASAAKPGAAVYEDLQILKGDIFTISVSGLKRVSITDPTIADVNDARAEAVEVIGIEPGQTTLFIWDRTGKRTVLIHVVEEDLQMLKKRLQGLLKAASIENIKVEVSALESKVVLSGDVPEDKMETYIKVIDPFTQRVINLATAEQSKDLVQIDMQITDISTTLVKQLGFDWSSGLVSIGSTADTSRGSIALGPPNITAVETPPTQNGSISDLFKIGNFTRSADSALVVRMNLLINEGKAKVLSKPRLLVVSGKEATFMVGGEVPIATTSTTGGGAGTTSSGTTFKTYGTTMSITPTIVDGKLVNIKLNVEISDIDRSVPSASGDVGYTTRSAHTQLVLENRQTIVLAGMIRRDKAKGVKRVPILSKIPLVGMLFRSETTPEQETELVISLTPTILLSEESRERLLAQEAAKKNAAGKTADDQLARKPAAVIPPKAPVPPVKAQVPTPPAAPKVPDPAPAPEPAGNEAADWDRSQIDVYARGIQAKIASAIAYPYEAQEKGWQGTVKLSLVIQKDGTLKAATVKETSGYEVFDQDAVNTAQILAPYEAFPSTAPAREITLNIPIVYSLDAFLSNVAKSE